VDGGVRLTHNADDPDEMFDVPHPKPGDVIEGEMVGEGDDEPAAAPERERVSVQHRPDPAPEAAAEAPADPRDEPAASQGQHRKIMALLGKHLVKGKHTDAHRHAVFSAILGEQITTGKQLSAAGADRIYEQLQAWDRDKTLPARVASMAPGQLGVDLAPYAGRPMRGGCHLCEAATLLMAPQIGREQWARYVYHHPTCPMVQWRGRRLVANRN
jgi:hypothetical protein